jgi:cytochrome c553
MRAQGSDLSNQDLEDLAAWFSAGAAARDEVTLEAFADFAAAKTCVACHGADYKDAPPTPPTLSGQHQDYLVNALKQYKSGARSGTIMSAFAATLSDADIERLAHFYSRQPGLRTPASGE